MIRVAQVRVPAVLHSRDLTPRALNQVVAQGYWSHVFRILPSELSGTVKSLFFDWRSRSPHHSYALLFEDVEHEELPSEIHRLKPNADAAQTVKAIRDGGSIPSHLLGGRLVTEHFTHSTPHLAIVTLSLYVRARMFVQRTNQCVQISNHKIRRSFARFISLGDPDEERSSRLLYGSLPTHQDERIFHSNRHFIRFRDRVMRMVAEYANESLNSEDWAPVEDTGMEVDLLPHQHNSLRFCLARESASASECWHTFQNDAGSEYAWSPFFGCFSETGSSSPPPHVSGGILADEMGMGKTVVCLSLHAKNPPPTSPPWSGGNTLVVCPVSLLQQWTSEARLRLEGTNREVYIHHGSRRNTDVEFLRTRDIVVTTYGILVSEWRTLSPTLGLKAVSWHRIIFDESHFVRNSGTRRFRACMELRSTHRWCVTGTPICNNLEDLHTQIRLVLNRNIRAFDHSRYGSDWSAQTLHFLSKIMMRHTKTMRFRDQPIVMLPRMQIDNVTLNWLTEAQADAYAEEHRQIRHAVHFDAVHRALIRIMRLRMRCSLGFVQSGSESEFMVTMMGDDDHSYHTMTEEEERIADEKMLDDTCPICLVAIDDPGLVRPCNHVFCYDCINLHVAMGGHACPMCRGRLSDNSIRKKRPREDDEQEDEAPARELFMQDNPKSLKLLEMIAGSDPEDKFIVFSNFPKTLLHAGQALDRHGVDHRYLRSQLSTGVKQRVIAEFQEGNVRVLLLPIKTAAVGLNLTAANRIVFLDPCITPSVEKQAIGRAWRIGQTRPVQVTKMLMANTVETSLIDVIRQDFPNSQRFWTFSRVAALMNIEN